MYTHRTYRRFDDNQRLVAFQAVVQETDLYIKAQERLEDTAVRLIRNARSFIEGYGTTHPDFLTSLTPISLDETAPPIVMQMMKAALQAGVGPMAAVAGAVAQHVGTGLLTSSAEIIVENGGDLFLKTDEPVTIDIFAGPSPLSQKVGIVFDPSHMPLGVCTSSGSVGPSLSLGKADAVTIASADTALADASATAIANIVTKPADIEYGLQRAQKTPGILGALIIIGDQIGAWGDMELVQL